MQELWSSSHAWVLTWHWGDRSWGDLKIEWSSISIKTYGLGDDQPCALRLGSHALRIVLLSTDLLCVWARWWRELCHCLPRCPSSVLVVTLYREKIYSFVINVINKGIIIVYNHLPHNLYKLSHWHNEDVFINGSWTSP